MLKIMLLSTPIAMIIGLSTAVIMSFSMQRVSAATSEDDIIQQGKALSFDRKKGNCLACHVMGDGQLPGNIGPPLIAMKARYPDKVKLREQIYDARIRNPHSMMLPFGPHGVLSDEEIDKITEYVYTL